MISRAALISAMPDLAHRAFDIQGARALSFVFEQGREIGVAEQVGAHAGNGEELHSGLSFCDRLKMNPAQAWTPQSKERTFLKEKLWFLFSTRKRMDCCAWLDSVRRQT
jgi:hypothetical protein